MTRHVLHNVYANGDMKSESSWKKTHQDQEEERNKKLVDDISDHLLLSYSTYYLWK